MMIRKSIFALPIFSVTLCFAEGIAPAIPEGKTPSQNYTNITPSAGPRVIDGVGLFFTGDYLYWTAREDGLEFASTGIVADTGFPHQEGHNYAPNFRYQSGLKFGMGFDFGHDTWDLLIDYTWLNTDGNRRSVSETSQQPLLNLIPIAISGQYAGLIHASGSWGLHFNGVDLELGRNFYISKFLSLRPFFGFKGTWQKQTFHVNYQTYESGDFSLHNQQFYWGVGPRLGVDTAWHFPGDWSMLAELSFTGLWGAFNMHRKDKASIYELNPINIGYQHHTVRPVMELMVGLRKETWFDKNRFHFSWQAGWEMQFWSDQNEFFLNTQQISGDLVFQGLTARMRFDF